jgi:hypothetical protein
MSEMSAAEAAVVARFDAAEPAPESWRGAPLEWVTCADLLTSCTHEGPHVPVGLDGCPVTARPVGDGDGRDGLRRLLAEAVARRIYAEGPDGEVDPTALVDELKPVVTAWAEQRARERAAEELRAVIQAMRSWQLGDAFVTGDVEVTRMWADFLADHADALAADDRAGQR